MIHFWEDAEKSLREKYKVTREAKYFLEKKCLLFSEEEHAYFRLFGFEGTSFLLSKFVTNRLFILELRGWYLY